MLVFDIERPQPHRRGDRELRHRRCAAGRRGRAGARRLSGLRHGVLPRRPSHAGVLRQRLQQFRRPRAVGRAGRLGAAAAPAAGRAAADRADRAQGRGLRLQGPGQHGPQPSRPHRLPAAVQRQVPPRHEAHADGHRQDAVGQLADPVLRPRARDRRRGLAGRHHRHAQPRRAARRRHADRGRDRSRSSASPTSRPRSCAACGWRTR